MEIPLGVRNALGLFPEIEGFLVARLLEQDDGDTVLELESSQAGEVNRERRRLNEEDLAMLMDLIATRLVERGSEVLMDQSGRGRFVLNETLLGLGYRGWALPVMLDLSSGQAIVATYLLTAGASFYVPFRLTRDRSVTQAHQRLSMYGGTRGILAGVLLGDALADPDSDSADRLRMGVGLAASVAGSVAGFLVVDAARANDGSAALWGVMGDFGLMGGAALAYAAGPYAQREVSEQNGIVSVHSETRNRSLGHTLTLLGGVGGLIAGARMGRFQAYTDGNASALRSVGVLGAQAGVTIARVLSEDGRVAAGIGLTGGIAAIAAGNRMLRDKRFSGGEGLLINAGHLGGGATALGLTYLIAEDVDRHELLYLTTSTIGSLLGAGLVSRALGNGSEDVGAGRGRDSRLTFHPENLIVAGVELLRPTHRLGSRSGPGTWSSLASPSARLPLVTFRF